MKKTFTDIKVGNLVVVYDEYAHDYTEHIIAIQEVETDEAYITESNPTGIKAFGRDLTVWDAQKQEYISDDYISLVHEGNFVRYFAH